MHVSMRIALLYLVLSVLWILLSDSILDALFPTYFITISLYKGWAFVCLSALILYYFLRREEKRRDTIETQLHHSSITDALTGLRNRSALFSHLDHAIQIARRDHSTFGLLFIDLDNFKNINDTQGHTTGDALLVGTAKKLSESIRSSDICARFGGDEFVVFVANDSDLDMLSYRLIDAFNTPVGTEKGEMQASISIGVAKFPHHGDTVDELIHAADTAMYQAKAAGRAQVVEAE